MVRKTKKATKKTLAERALECKTAKKLLTLVKHEVTNDSYVYRGTSEVYTWKGSTTDKRRINSSIFRRYDEKIGFGEDYQPAHIETEIIKEARPYFLPHTSNIEILSDLRHFGGDTTLIDFSKDVLVALFFACSQKFKKNGELIALPIAKIKNRGYVYFYENDREQKQPPTELSLLPPAQTQTNKARVIAQKSVFIHTPQGFILPDLCKIIPIKSELKEPILDYLKHFHDIDERTIYPDLHGFIATQSRFDAALTHFYAGNALSEQKKYKEAVAKYTEAIRLKPDFASAYLNRGLTKANTKKLEEAIADYDEAIRLKPDYAKVYSSRGLAKADLKKPQEAIADFDRAIQINPNYVEAYYNRGVTNAESNRIEEASADFDEAIRIRPDYAEAYSNRGVTKIESKKPKEAIEDFTNSINIKPDHAEAYAGRSVAWMMLKEHKKALSDLFKAHKLGFRMPNSWDED